VSFAAHLLERLCQLDIAALPVMRDPAKDNDYSRDYGDWSSTVTKAARSSGSGSGYHRFAPTLGDLVWDNPEVATLMLEEFGITVDDFNKCLDDYYAPSTRKH